MNLHTPLNNPYVSSVNTNPRVKSLPEPPEPSEMPMKSAANEDVSQSGPPSNKPAASGRVLRTKKTINYRNLASGQKELHLEAEVLATLMSRVPIKNDVPTRRSAMIKTKAKEKAQDDLLKEFLILAAHTSISQAKREEDGFPEVDQAVSNEIDQMLKDSKGKKAVLKMMKRTFNTKGKKIVPSLMFMKKKLHKGSGEFLKWKARLVAGGHMQYESLYPKHDITVPTWDHASLMMFLSIMMKKGDARFYQMDFPGAYLKGDLPTEIYLRMNKATVDILKKSHPEVIPDIRADGTLISRIQKALYGLKESGKIFRDLSVEVLENLD